MRKLADRLLGTDPKMRRMLGYWAATGVFYLACIGMLLPQIASGTPERAAAVVLAWFGVGGVGFFFVLVRASAALRLAPWQLAGAQALFAIACNAAAYAVTGPMRGASLMIMLVVIVFCAFSLRPRQTLLLCAAAIAALAATMGALVARNPVVYPPKVEAMTFALAASSLLAVALLTGEMSKLRARLKQQKEELLRAVTTIRTLATVDELTSLANRRHMNDVLRDEERRERAGGEPACIALLDIDFFKRVNDRFGHAGGDAVLRTFAAAARTELREADVLARWGGEEFLLLLPGTSLDEAVRVLERMAVRVGAIPVPDLDVALRVTFSAGVAERRGGEPFADTISRADKAMYLAKSSGRDRVVQA